MTRHHHLQPRVSKYAMYVVVNGTVEVELVLDVAICSRHNTNQTMILFLLIFLQVVFYFLLAGVLVFQWR